VDKYGAVEWMSHPVMRSGEVALKSKVLSLRLEPSRNPSPLAAEAYAAVRRRQILPNTSSMRILNPRFSFQTGFYDVAISSWQTLRRGDAGGAGAPGQGGVVQVHPGLTAFGCTARN
jgi:hypothetical protein